ncbi:MAG: LCP family protein, partial [Oscillospiraceae bacterium]|nr:LCP family protein [Oscillospiraceae bacterium]
MKESERNADLPRPRNTSQNYQDLQNAIPELRRVDNANTIKQSEQSFNDTMKMQQVRPVYEEFENDDDDYEEDFGYGAYEEYDNADWRQEHTSMKKSAPRKNTQTKQKNYQQGKQAVKKSNKSKKKKKSHGGGFLNRLVRKLIILVAIVFGIYSAIALLLISKLEKIPKGERTVTSGTLEAGYVQNILLIGTDARDITTERGRSDTILLLSLNSRTQKIYLTSFMRDAYVEIPNHGNDKLNAAYSFGGAELLMDTLELNYHISIDDYLCVSFMGFAKIIDAFGGVEIDVSDAEAEALNVILQSEVNALAGDDIFSDFLEKGGKYILNGKQALSYARIRYVGNADFERTSRQREVMTQIFQNAKSKMATAVPELVSSALPNLGSNMSTAELYFLSLRVPFAVSYEIEQLQIPAPGTYTPADIDGQSVLQVDFNANIQVLQDSVFSLPDEN